MTIAKLPCMPRAVWENRSTRASTPPCSVPTMKLPPKSAISAASAPTSSACPLSPKSSSPATWASRSSPSPVSPTWRPEFSTSPSTTKKSSKPPPAFAKTSLHSFAPYFPISPKTSPDSLLRPSNHNAHRRLHSVDGGKTPLVHRQPHPAARIDVQQRLPFRHIAEGLHKGQADLSVSDLD